MDERDPPPVDPNLELEPDGVVVLNGSVDPDAAPIARDEKDDVDDGPIFSGELFARLVRFARFARFARCVRVVTERRERA